MFRHIFAYGRGSVLKKPAIHLETPDKDPGYPGEYPGNRRAFECDDIKDLGSLRTSGPQQKEF